MVLKKYSRSIEANEVVSKYKLLSSYGGPGSIIHTEYGSILVSSIEEWGFIHEIEEFIAEAESLKVIQEKEYITVRANSLGLKLSNDERLLEAIKQLKLTPNLKYLCLIPDIHVNTVYNTIEDDKTSISISSTFFPKVFFDNQNNYNTYNVWYKKWIKDNSADNFFPPKTRTETNVIDLKQDNIVLICNHGHISDFPWSKYLRWRKDAPHDLNIPVDLFSNSNCCGTDENPTALIKITFSNSNSSGFDGKWLKCENCQKQTSLEGLMGVKIICPGHNPWQATTGKSTNHYGDKLVRNQLPKHETCISPDTMRVALTTGNNLYYSIVLSSIYIPPALFLNEDSQKINVLESQKKTAVVNNDFLKAHDLNEQIKQLQQEINENNIPTILTNKDKELLYRYEEYKIFAQSAEEDINIDEDLQVENVTNVLNEDITPFFDRILKLENMKVTTAQLGFSRVDPIDADAVNTQAQDIFRSSKESVQVYPVVENFGEGIFISLNEKLVDDLNPDVHRFEEMIKKDRIPFALGAVNIAKEKKWQLYLVHTLCHLLMRELEFKCGYPTASLSERIYVSNNEDTKMYGFMIYTSGGAEGSMGGLIAQTRKESMNQLIRSALKRSTICNSDPLCWGADGQGLFELNLASCFSCSLVSETSCEHRNLYLDRRILVDEEFGFFKGLLE